MEDSFCIKKQKKAYNIWYIALIFCLVTLIQYLAFSVVNNSSITFTVNLKGISVCTQKRLKHVEHESSSSCADKYIYIQNLPSKFNSDIIRDCSSIIEWQNMCMFISNFGMGPVAKNYGNILQNKSWYATDQFLLEVIFHSKMKSYKCLTNDSALATAIFVPFYAGLDVGRYVVDGSNSERDATSVELAKWIANTDEWKRMQGHDHFSALGRIAIDFRRESDDRWGNKLLTLPEFNNMTLLGIESDSQSPNEIAIPYPTYFHPSNDDEVFQWQEKVTKSKRPYLYTFVGCPRPNMTTSIRDQIIQQCIASYPQCKLLDCDKNDCTNPVNVMKMFKKSVFCLQPAGDSYTRRSTFDSILAGCIPVFFHPSSAYTQYIWHLPKDYTKYSVLIPEEGLRDKTTNIEEVLKKIRANEVVAMRKEVIKLIPKISYADPRSRFEKFEDAFDIAVQKVIENINEQTHKCS